MRFAPLRGGIPLRSISRSELWSKKRWKTSEHIFALITPRWLHKCGSSNLDSNPLSTHLRVGTSCATHRSLFGLPFPCATFGDLRRNRRLPAFRSSVPSPKSLGFRCVQNGPPARREEGAYLNRQVSERARSGMRNGGPIAISLSSESPAIVYGISLARSSSRSGHGPLKAGARVRVPYALPVDLSYSNRYT